MSELTCPKCHGQAIMQALRVKLVNPENPQFVTLLLYSCYKCDWSAWEIQK